MRRFTEKWKKDPDSRDRFWGNIWKVPCDLNPKFRQRSTCLLCNSVGIVKCKYNTQHTDTDKMQFLKGRNNIFRNLESNVPFLKKIHDVVRLIDTTS